MKTRKKTIIAAMLMAAVMCSAVCAIPENVHAGTKKTDSTITYTGTENRITYKVVCTRATGKCVFTFTVKNKAKKNRTIRYKLGTPSNGGDRINSQVKLKKGKKSVTVTEYFDNKGYSRNNKVNAIYWLDGTPYFL